MPVPHRYAQPHGCVGEAAGRDQHVFSVMVHDDPRCGEFGTVLTEFDLIDSARNRGECSIRVIPEEPICGIVNPVAGMVPDAFAAAAREGVGCFCE